MLAIGGLGAPAWDITAAGDCPQNLPLWGGMGGAAMMGLGLALAQPTQAGAGHHRRRRDADGRGLAGHHRGASSRATFPSWCWTTSITARPACRRRRRVTAWTSPAWPRRAGIADCRKVTTPAEVRRCARPSAPAPAPIFAQVKIDGQPCRWCCRRARPRSCRRGCGKPSSAPRPTCNEAPRAARRGAGHAGGGARARCCSWVAGPAAPAHHPLRRGRQHRCHRAAGRPGAGRTARPARGGGEPAGRRRQYRRRGRGPGGARRLHAADGGQRHPGRQPGAVPQPAL